MSEIKQGFTPGPWRVLDGQQKISVTSGSGSICNLSVRTKSWASEARGVEQAINDAKLIADAPRMYAENVQLREELSRLTQALEAARGNLDQILHDPENQPSQFGTYPSEYVDNLHELLRQFVADGRCDCTFHSETCCAWSQANTLLGDNAAHHAREQEKDKKPRCDPGCLWPKCDCEHDCR